MAGRDGTGGLTNHPTWPRCLLTFNTAPGIWEHRNDYCEPKNDLKNPNDRVVLIKIQLWEPQGKAKSLRQKEQWFRTGGQHQRGERTGTRYVSNCLHSFHSLISIGENYIGLDLSLDITILDASSGRQERAGDGGRGIGELARETGRSSYTRALDPGRSSYTRALDPGWSSYTRALVPGRRLVHSSRLRTRALKTVHDKVPGQ